MRARPRTHAERLVSTDGYFGPDSIIRRLGNTPVTRKSLVDALNNMKNFDDGGITPPISYEPGNHDPLHCLQWLHNFNGQWRTTSGWNCFG